MRTIYCFDSDLSLQIGTTTDLLIPFEFISLLDKEKNTKIFQKGKDYLSVAIAYSII